MRRPLHRFEIGSRSLFLHHEPLPRLQEELELPHISRGSETARIPRSVNQEPTSRMGTEFIRSSFKFQIQAFSAAIGIENVAA